MKLAVIRTSAVPLRRDFYNIQEIGLAKELVKDGISVDLFLASPSGDLTIEKISSANSAMGRIHFLRPIKIFQQHGWLIGLFDFLRKGDYDLIQVHEYNVFLSLVISIWGNKNKIKVVLFQGLYTDPSRRFSRILNKIYDIVFLPFFLKVCSGAICKTKFAKNYLEGKGFQNLRVSHVGLDHTLLRLKHVTADRNNTGVQLLYVGNFEERRNVLFLLKLISSLNRDDDRFNLTLIGSGDLQKDLLNCIRNEKLYNFVEVLQPVPQSELCNYYHSSDIFLFPSNYEIYGMVILEAMYFGLPVISTVTAGSAEIIDHDVDGILIDSLDINKWKNAVKSLSENKERLIQMGKAAKLKINEKFLWKNTSCDFTDFYVDVYQQKG